MKNLRTMKKTELFHQFLEKLQSYRLIEGTDKEKIPMQYLPDILVKYFKLNKERYLELVKLEDDDGNK